MITEAVTALERVPHRFNTNLRMYINQIDADFPPHWHTDIEIIYPTVGTYKVNCGGRSFFLEQGDILLICPAVIHEIFTTTPSGTRFYIQADFTKSVVLKDIESAFRDMAPALHIRSATCPVEIYRTLCNYIHDIQKVYFGAGKAVEMIVGRDVDHLMSYTGLDPYGEVEIYTILMRFITLAGKNLALIRQTIPANHVESRRNRIPLSSVCAYLAEHFTEEMSLEDIASYAGYSKFHFARIFSEYTGETFYQYLQQKRIGLAQTLLSNPLLSITDIAYQSGFASSTAFTRAFRKSTGYTPSQFRLLNEEQHPLSEDRIFSHIQPRDQG